MTHLQKIRALLVDAVPEWSWSLHRPDARRTRTVITGLPREADWSELAVEISGVRWSLYRLTVTRGGVVRKRLRTGGVQPYLPPTVALRVARAIEREVTS